MTQVMSVSCSLLQFEQCLFEVTDEKEVSESLDDATIVFFLEIELRVSFVWREGEGG